MKGYFPFLGIMRHKDHIHLEFTIAVFPTMGWKLSKNKASIGKSRTEMGQSGWGDEEVSMTSFNY